MIQRAGGSEKVIIDRTQSMASQFGRGDVYGRSLRALFDELLQARFLPRSKSALTSGLEIDSRGDSSEVAWKM
jgi:hypothetical protein